MISIVKLLSCQVIDDMKKVYDNLIIINQNQKTQFFETT